MERDFIAVIDFGGQYAHLIAKRIRHLGVFTRIFSPRDPAARLEGAKGLILSGGPQSVVGADAVPFDPELLSFDGPLLGLCYGHQLLAHHLGGEVRGLAHGEFGSAVLRLDDGAESALLAGVPRETGVWMSHGDTVTAAPPGFRVLASTAGSPVAAMAHTSLPRFGLQFHPEVNDTPEGTRMLANFVEVTQAERGWSMAAFVAEAMERCRAEIGARNVLMFLSGGVDSTVAYTLLGRALGTERVRGLLIDTGFMRKRETAAIMARYRDLRLQNVDLLDAGATFLAAVEGLADPQAKRVAIGETFVRVREQYLAGLRLEPAQWMLGQGTLYPDIIESGGTDHAQVIKSHHNRVGVIEEMIAAGQVVEPLRDLYKDEVRSLGTELGLPPEIVWRHPFPGPGLAINVLCADGTEEFAELPATQRRLEPLLADGPYRGWPLPVRSVGVQGDARSYTPPVALAGPGDWERLEACSTAITNALREVNRVVLLLNPTDPPTLLAHRAFCTPGRLDLLREADHLATEMLEREGLMREIFQLLVILLPLGPAGSGESVVLRPVVSEDVMTARFARLPWSPLLDLAGRIKALPGVHAVFYDVTHKPPATFGWE
ncbi:MAG: glutamine-hydrolyzing GMP synthase [bacterium]